MDAHPQTSRSGAWADALAAAALLAGVAARIAGAWAARALPSNCASSGTVRTSPSALVMELKKPALGTARAIGSMLAP